MLAIYGEYNIMIKYNQKQSQNNIAVSLSPAGYYYVIRSCNIAIKDLPESQGSWAQGLRAQLHIRQITSAHACYITGVHKATLYTTTQSHK